MKNIITKVYDAMCRWNIRLLATAVFILLGAASENLTAGTTAKGKTESWNKRMCFNFDLDWNGCFDGLCRVACGERQSIIGCIELEASCHGQCVPLCAERQRPFEQLSDICGLCGESHIFSYISGFGLDVAFAFFHPFFRHLPRDAVRRE